MFTARTQMDDKITGYESGVDDYLTKPIHPAELTAHLRALLSRSKARSTPAKDLGYMVGVISAKGGVGVSTVALNLAIAFQQKAKIDVIAAEMRPGQGTWAVELGGATTDGLGNLLRTPASEITAIAVENELSRVPYGVRLLMASSRAVDAGISCAEDQMSSIAENLRLLARLVLLDIGNTSGPFFDVLLQHCNELVIVTEPYPVSVQRTRQLIEDLHERGFGRGKLLSLVSVNRVRADVQLSMIQMQEILGLPVTQVFPPAPEHAFQAANRSIPLMQVQIGGVIGQQFLNLAEKLMQRVPA
jgi:pilus assembly protein CpaE